MKVPVLFLWFGTMKGGEGKLAVIVESASRGRYKSAEFGYAFIVFTVDN